MKNKHAVARVTILRAIFEHFQQATQWLNDNPEYVARFPHYLSNAEALIELLEVEDCGSCGGFDPNNQMENRAEGSYSVYERFLLLVKKYKNEKDIKTEIYFNLDTMGQFWKKLADLRETFNQSGLRSH